MFYEPAILDTTPLPTPLYSNTVEDRPRTSQRQKADRESGGTPLRAYALPQIKQIRVGTGTLAEMQQASGSSQINVSHVSPVEAAAEKARKNRVVLLAQKYEGQMSPESAARLELLTQRIRRLTPRVTQESINILAAVVDEMEIVSDELDQLRGEFNF